MTFLGTEQLEPRRLFAGTPPLARAYPPSIEADGSTSLQIPIVFTDSTGLNHDAIANAPELVKVFGPNGFRAVARLAGLGGINGAPEFNGYYELAAPGGAWTANDAGTYKVIVLGATLIDQDGNATPEGKIGSFQVTATASSPTIDPTPAPAPTPPSALLGKYRGWRTVSPDVTVVFDLKITSVIGNRVKGIFLPTAGSPDSAGYAVHGVLKTGGKISLIGYDSAGVQQVAITAKISGDALIGNVLFDLGDSADETGPFKVSKKS